MKGFKAIDPMELEGNAISLFHEGWGLLTAGDMGSFNTMTISWGQLGCLWNKPVCTVFVRPCRYTYGFMEKNGRYTVSLFEKGAHREALGLLGTKSGRDGDKVTESGLTVVEAEGLPAFAEAKAILVIEKLYDDQFRPERVPESIRKAPFYNGAADDDLHRIYFGEIVKAYVKE